MYMCVCALYNLVCACVRYTSPFASLHTLAVYDHRCSDWQSTIYNDKIYPMTLHAMTAHSYIMINMVCYTTCSDSNMQQCLSDLLDAVEHLALGLLALLAQVVDEAHIKQATALDARALIHMESMAESPGI